MGSSSMPAILFKSIVQYSSAKQFRNSVLDLYVHIIDVHVFYRGCLKVYSTDDFIQLYIPLRISCFLNHRYANCYLANLV